jgi:hypothetical protein
MVLLLLAGLEELITGPLAAPAALALKVFRLGLGFRGSLLTLPAAAVLAATEVSLFSGLDYPTKSSLAGYSKARNGLCNMIPETFFLRNI